MDDIIFKVEEYVKEHISEFHDNRIKKLEKLKLDKLLKSKNPYMYKAKNINSADKIVRSLATAFLSSAEESLFGNWLEGLAIFVAKQVYGGYKSSAKGIDIELDKDGCHYLVSIKSGPRWGNSSAIEKLRDYFRTAMRIFQTSGNKVPCRAIEGCCYGSTHKDDDPQTKISGQEFWQFISDSETLYSDIIEPMGSDAKAKNEAYEKKYDAMINKFVVQFVNKYCYNDGSINWSKIMELNSGIQKPKTKNVKTKKTTKK